MKTIKASKDYLALVKECPLLPIKTRAEYDAALQMLSKLGIKDYDMTPTESSYFDVLSMLIRDYEKPRVKDKGTATPQELVKWMMEEHRLKQADIARIIGYESHVSAFLAGKRNLSPAEATKLGKHFAIDPEALLPARKVA